MIISCTNRPGNLSIHLARFYHEGLAALGIPSTLYNLEEMPPRLLETDLYGSRSESFAPVQQMIIAATHYLFILPEYNGSIPGVFKLWLDACDYPESFKGKQGWMVGLGAGERGNAPGLNHLRDIMDYLGTELSGEEVKLGMVRSKIAPDGKITDGETQRLLEAHLASIAAALQA